MEVDRPGANPIPAGAAPQPVPRRQAGIAALAAQFERGPAAGRADAPVAGRQGAAQRAVFAGANQGAGPDTLKGMDKRMITDSIKAGKNVFVAGFSSQGGGHTERMMKPLGQAVGQGDTVVIALPPHWENDRGNEAKNLDKFSAQYRDAGANVVTVQADKAIWGFYKPEGPSDNFRILEEFAMKPQRDTDQTPLYGRSGDDAALGQGFKHKDIVQQVVNVAGQDHMDQIKVFEDMDPYLGKGATGAGVPKSQILGQSNHVLLLDADEYLQGKSDAFLVKANGNGHNGMMATIDYNANVNKTASLGETLDKLEISPEHRTVDVRRDMVATLMQNGNKIYPDDPNPVTKSGGVIVSRDATEQSIDRGVYLYLNSYTGPIADHIKERLSGDGDTTPEQQAAYEKAMFVVCGGGTFPGEFNRDPNTVSNAMHIAQAANFEGVTSAGFGTSSEMHYLIENDAYQGNFIVMPVEQQHEQEANANELLPASFSSPENAARVTTANDIEQLKTQMDDLVMVRATTTHDLHQSNTRMGGMLEATHQPGAIADKAASLLQGTGEMSGLDVRLLNENNERSGDVDRKEARQLNKVMIPVLQALVDGQPNATIRLTAKVPAVTINVADFVAGMSDPATRMDTLRDMAGVEVTGDQSTQLTTQFAAGLDSVMEQPAGAERQQAADDYRRGEYANTYFTVGY